MTDSFHEYTTVVNTSSTVLTVLTDTNVTLFCIHVSYLKTTAL